MRKLAAELIGTYVLIFAGCGAVVVNQDYGKALTLVGVALVWGLVVLALVYALGDVSGAHINPAVTIGFVLAGRFPLVQAGPYIVAQCLGATLAAASLATLFPADAFAVGTRPHEVGGVAQSFYLEVFLTAVLMFVVMQVSTGAKEKGLLAGVAVGATITLLVLFGGPISGASMNPARSLGPAVVSAAMGQTTELNDLWLYLVAPPVGATVAVLLWWLLRDPAEG